MPWASPRGGWAPVARKEDPVQAGAGVEVARRLGDHVEAGQPVMTLHRHARKFRRALEALDGGW
jgi:thymidine phosphorylase